MHMRLNKYHELIVSIVSHQNSLISSSLLENSSLSKNKSVDYKTHCLRDVHLFLTEDERDVPSRQRDP